MSSISNTRLRLIENSPKLYVFDTDGSNVNTIMADARYSVVFARSRTVRSLCRRTCGTRSSRPCRCPHTWWRLSFPISSTCRPRRSGCGPGARCCRTLNTPGTSGPAYSSFTKTSSPYRTRWRKPTWWRCRILRPAPWRTGVWWLFGNDPLAAREANRVHKSLSLFSEIAMLYDEGVSPNCQKERVAMVVSHELAHQWFGNLVTPDWWSDLWLNEGFATYIEYIGVDHVRNTQSSGRWRLFSFFPLIFDLHRWNPSGKWKNSSSSIVYRACF